MLEPKAYSPNPHIAYSWLWINGTSVTVDDASGKPKHLESFECSFSTETLGKFEFVLFDPEYDVVEDLIAEGKGDCQFKFGYTTGRQSPTYQGIIMEYTPEFLFDGIRLHLKGLLTTVKAHSKQKTRAWKEKKISEIVQEICDDNGWTGVIDETKDVWAREDLDITELKKMKFNQHCTDWTFMMEILQKQAVRQSDDAGGYIMYYDSAENEFHFHPPYNTTDIHKTFTWRDRMNEFIRFSPVYQANILARILTGGSTQAASQDQESDTKVDGVQSQNKGTGEGKTTDSNATQTEEPFSEKPFEATARLNKGFRDKQTAENEAKYWWYRAAWVAALKGELEVIGDPELKPWKKYRVNVAKKTGGLHWTSGEYLCFGIRHTISGGRYVSTLQLKRSDAKSGTQASKRPS